MKVSNKELMEIIDKGPYKVQDFNKNIIEDSQKNIVAHVTHDCPNSELVAEAIARVLNSASFKRELSNIDIRNII
ncbi:hypothetical protein RG089_002818 [Elizabethkingia anophelis]|nr:hypothetical protein [Elizabethkingia anophelis]ELB1894312.1 hypothetical protein [Elizabethkingia anophelis]